MHGEPRYEGALPHLNYVNPNAPKGGELRLGVLGSFDSLNPLNIRGEPAAGIIENVYEPLMARSYSEPFSLYGLIAETIDTPEDRGSVTFQIRAGARFSDGQPITPEDVLFSWALLKDKGRKNHREYYKKVTAAEKAGERGVKFTFEGGDREMPLIMGLMPVLPKHAVAPENFDKTSFAIPIGSGPYTAAKVSPGASIEFRRNPDYWGRDLPIRRGQFNFDVIRIDYYRDSAAMREAFRKGLFDVLGDSDAIDAVTWADAFDFPAVRDGSVRKMEFDVGVPAPVAALAFNMRRPNFADARVREALTRLFDFEWIGRALYRGLYARTESFFDRSVLSSHGRPAGKFERELLAPYASELAPGALEGALDQPVSDGLGTNREGRKEAFRLLTQAGYELRDGVMTAKATGQPFAFEMLCTTRDQQHLMLAYASALRQAGIDAQVRMVDSAQFQRRATSFDYDMILAGWGSSLSPGNEQSFRWSSVSADEEASYNYAGVKSPAVDAMIAAILGAKSREDFVFAVRALDRVLLSGRYGILLYYAPKQWIAAWSHLRQPPGSTLYGARLETWWDGNAETASAQTPN
jgi:peptide/nickel transport system substrate-binding protein